MNRDKKRRLLWLLIILLGIGACAWLLFRFFFAQPIAWTPQTALHRVAAPPLNHVREVGPLRQAMAASVDYYKALPGETVFCFGPDSYTAVELAANLEDLSLRLDQWGATSRFFDYMRLHCQFYESTADSLQVTGYYEIRLQGSRTSNDEYRHPIYQKPADLVRIDLRNFLPGEYNPPLPELLRGRLTPEQALVPYYSRQEIDRRGILANKNLEICWIKDAYRLFFLHIQGSGIIEFADGSELSVNYADSNGLPYHSIGRTLIDQYGVKADTLSMQGIYDYLVSHPDSAAKIMDSNPSYVFFRTVPQGPIGSLGRALTPLCSMATDSRLFPKGALAFLESELPEFDDQGKVKAWRPYSGLIMNQDTGGAIRGRGRVDWFIGSDLASELTAGHLKQPGRLFFLAPKKN